MSLLLQLNVLEEEEEEEEEEEFYLGYHKLIRQIIRHVIKISMEGCRKARAIGADHP